MAELCDCLRDGRLSSTSGAPEPQDEGIRIDLLLDPINNLLQNGLSCMRMALWRITPFTRVMERAGRGRCLQLFQACEKTRKSMSCRYSLQDSAIIHTRTAMIMIFNCSDTTLVDLRVLGVA